MSEPATGTSETKPTAAPSGDQAAILDYAKSVGEYNQQGQRIFRVGNLIYTKKGLYALFFWLLWFDFCFTIMEAVWDPILSMRLKNELNMDSFWYVFFLSTIPSVVNFVLNPIISIRSDRHRGPRGRRIPFLLYGAPIVCLCLFLMGFGNDIGTWVQTSFLSTWSTDQVIIWTFIALFMVFTVANMLLGTTFYYLFNDVVPEEHFVKFMSYFRVAGGLAGMVYSYFIYGYSFKWGPLNLNLGFWEYHNQHFWYPKLILCGTATIYMVAATIAILKVKEPAYPPPPKLARGEGFFAKTLSTVKVLSSECFCHRFYVLYFITQMVLWLSYQMGRFGTNAMIGMGLDMDKLGKINTITGFVGLILVMCTASWGDRWKPLPMMVFSMILLVVTSPIQLLFLIPNLSPNTYFLIQIAFSWILVPITLVNNMAEFPLGMSILPRDRYGQFCSVNAMLRMIPAIFGSMAAGWIMTRLENHYIHYGQSIANTTDPEQLKTITKYWQAYAWRYTYVWNAVFQALATFCYYMLYREWKKLGGKHGFTPPAVDVASDSKPRDIVAT